MGKLMNTNGLASLEAAARALAAGAAARSEHDSQRLDTLERRLEAMEEAVLASQRRVLDSQEHLIRRVNELGATLAALYRETRTIAARRDTRPGAARNLAGDAGPRTGPGAGLEAAPARGVDTRIDDGALAPTASWRSGPPAPVDYDALVHRVRSLIEATVPPGSEVSVVSRGDSMLLELDSRIGRHFPADEDGSWAGYHPRDSEAAIEHLERLRAQGVTHFVLPQASYWWLEYYDAFTRYLEGRYRLILHREDTARIYALDEAGAGARAVQ